MSGAAMGGSKQRKSYVERRFCWLCGPPGVSAAALAGAGGGVAGEAERQESVANAAGALLWFGRSVVVEAAPSLSRRIGPEGSEGSDPSGGAAMEGAPSPSDQSSTWRWAE